jgi:hypothetical protein
MVGSDGSVAFAWLRLEAHFASASDSLAELPLLHGYDDSSWIELYFNLDHADISQPHQQFIANSAGFTLVPDPGSLGLMGIGLLAASLARRRRH